MSDSSCVMSSAPDDSSEEEEVSKSKQKSSKKKSSKPKLDYKLLFIEETEEELKYRRQLFPDDDDDFLNEAVKCTSCSRNLSSLIKSGQPVYKHITLEVLLCKKCSDFFGDGVFSADEDGTDKYCRWCGQGGMLYCCAKCSCAFCKSCIKRNLSASVLSDLEREDWLCLICNSRPLWRLRAICEAALQYISRKKRLIAENRKRKLLELEEKKKSPQKRRIIHRRRDSSSDFESRDDTPEPSCSGLHTRSNRETKRNGRPTRSCVNKSSKLNHENSNAEVKEISDDEQIKEIKINEENSNNSDSLLNHGSTLNNRASPQDLDLNDDMPEVCDEKLSNKALLILKDVVSDMCEVLKSVDENVQVLSEKKINLGTASKPRKVSRIVNCFHKICRRLRGDLDSIESDMDLCYDNWKKKVVRREKKRRLLSKRSSPATSNSNQVVEENGASNSSDKSGNLRTEVAEDDKVHNDCGSGVEDARDERHLQKSNASKPKRFQGGEAGTVVTNVAESEKVDEVKAETVSTGEMEMDHASDAETVHASDAETVHASQADMPCGDKDATKTAKDTAENSDFTLDVEGIASKLVNSVTNLRPASNQSSGIDMDDEDEVATIVACEPRDSDRSMGCEEPSGVCVADAADKQEGDKNKLNKPTVCADGETASDKNTSNCVVGEDEERNADPESNTVERPHVEKDALNATVCNQDKEIDERMSAVVACNGNVSEHNAINESVDMFEDEIEAATGNDAPKQADVPADDTEACDDDDRISVSTFEVLSESAEDTAVVNPEVPVKEDENAAHEPEEKTIKKPLIFVRKDLMAKPEVIDVSIDTSSKHDDSLPVVVNGVLSTPEEKTVSDSVKDSSLTDEAVQARRALLDCSTGDETDDEQHEHSKRKKRKKKLLAVKESDSLYETKETRSRRRIGPRSKVDASVKSDVDSDALDSDENERSLRSAKKRKGKKGTSDLTRANENDKTCKMVARVVIQRLSKEEEEKYVSKYLDESEKGAGDKGKKGVDSKCDKEVDRLCDMKLLKRNRNKESSCSGDDVTPQKKKKQKKNLDKLEGGGDSPEGSKKSLSDIDDDPFLSDTPDQQGPIARQKPVNTLTENDMAKKMLLDMSSSEGSGEDELEDTVKTKKSKEIKKISEKDIKKANDKGSGDESENISEKEEVGDENNDDTGDKDARTNNIEEDAANDEEDKAEDAKSDDEAEAEKSHDKAEAEKSHDKAEAKKSHDKAGAKKSQDKAEAEKSHDKAEKSRDKADAEKSGDEADAEKSGDEAEAEKSHDEAEAAKSDHKVEDEDKEMKTEAEAAKSDHKVEDGDEEMKTDTKTEKDASIKAGSDDSSDESDPKIVKKSWRRDKLLSGKLSLTDSSEEERRWEKNKAKREAKAEIAKKNPRKVLGSDSDDYKKVSDDDSSDSDFVATKKRQRGKENRSDSDSVKTVDSDSSGHKKKTKRRRIRQPVSDSSDSDVMETSQRSEGQGKGRKNIRRVIKDEDVADATRRAAREEEERRKRIADKQKVYNELYEIPENFEALDKLVLDFDPETKEELVSVHPNLVKKLKPHQVKGVKFMWDACFESVRQIKKNKGTGCILAHCMGLGKTFQVVTLAHTVLSNKATKVKTILVVVPKSTVLNWISEFNSWLKDTKSKFMIGDLSKTKQYKSRMLDLRDWHLRGGIMVLSYEMFRDLVLLGPQKLRKKQDVEQLHEALLDPGPDLVVCDEGHLLKNEATKISKAMTMIGTLRRIVLTGTPLQNNLAEYHCMVQFVKPNLLGTRKEFQNRFVNPIINGSYVDSNAHDVKVMKRRAHVLHKMLDSSVQRFDYAVLMPYLPPKQEFAIFIRLTELQVKLYQRYLDENVPELKARTTKLFSDFHILQRVCTHPKVLQMHLEKNEKTAEKKRLMESDSEGSLKDFIDDDDSSAESQSSKSTTSDSDVVCVDEGKENSSKPGKKQTRRTRQNADGGSEAEPEIEEEVVKKYQEWWQPLVEDESVFTKLAESGKLMLLFFILRECEKIGDKVLVFSQSLSSLDLIEYFLHQVDEATQNNSVDDTLGNHTGNWVRGLDYFRFDGGTSLDNRSSFCKAFNNEDNHRARLFLISTRAGGLGINLYGANRVVIFDASWNPSHDVQSIFRVYRFGQKKPCYIYRFLAKGTMEEKIYDRQVTKLSLSCRVVDEQQIERHYNMADLQELYNFNPEPSTTSTPKLPKDRLLAEMLKEHEKVIDNYHEHDSLLENKEEEELNEEERKAAWEDFENEKKGKTQFMAGYPGAGLQHLDTVALKEELRKQNPTITDQELDTKLLETVQRIMTFMKAQQQQQIQQQQMQLQQQRLMNNAALQQQIRAYNYQQQQQQSQVFKTTPVLQNITTKQSFPMNKNHGAVYPKQYMPATNYVYNSFTNNLPKMPNPALMNQKLKSQLLQPSMSGGLPKVDPTHKPVFLNPAAAAAAANRKTYSKVNAPRDISGQQGTAGKTTDKKQAPSKPPSSDDIETID